MLSVIIPVYNVEKYLKKSVESVLNQTLKEIEIILVDDGSTDNSGKICDEISTIDKRVKVFHKENGGVSSARNYGIKKCSGEYIYFMDSDDTADSTMLEKMMNSVKKNSDVELVICGYKLLSNRILQHSIPGEIVNDIYYSSDFIEKLICNSLLNPLWNKLFLKSKIGYFDETKSMGEDLLFVINYLNGIRKVEFIDETLYEYVKREGAATSTFKPERIETIVSSYNILSNFLNDSFNGKYNKKMIFDKYFNNIDSLLQLPFYKLKRREEIMDFYEKIINNKEFLQFVKFNNLSDEYLFDSKKTYDYYNKKTFFKRQIKKTINLIKK